jgi:hypothetical protein
MMTPRYKARIPLLSSVAFSNGCVTGLGIVLDLTAPGCMIESTIAVTKGEYLQLKIFLPGFESCLSVKLAAVRWSKGKRFGTEFIKMDQSERLMLDRFMTEHVCNRTTELDCPETVRLLRRTERQQERKQA